MTVFDDMNAAIFSSDLADDADYIAKAGWRKNDIHICAVSPDVELGDAALVQQSQYLFDVRMSDIPSAKKGDQIVVKDPSQLVGTYQLLSDAKASDSDRTLWRCPCARA
jgi:hypothetical protein